MYGKVIMGKMWQMLNIEQEPAQNTKDMTAHMA